MALFYDTDIQYLKGVGPKLATVFAKKGIYTAGDLLEWYPRSYEDRRSARNIASLKPDELVSLLAYIVKVSSIPMGRYRKMYEVLVSDSSGKLSCKYFRMPYKGYFDRFQPGMQVRVSGKLTPYRGRMQMQHPDIHFYDENEENVDEILPLYSDIDGIKAGKIRVLVTQVIDQLIDRPSPLSELDQKLEKTKGVPEDLPAWMIEKYNLMPKGKALKSLHQPGGDEPSDLYIEYKTKAQHRIIFDEFFWLELHLARKRKGIQREMAPSLCRDSKMAEKIKASLPFKLTGAQSIVLKEINRDLKKSHPMHRLVQGDVGCGKTLVGLLSCVRAIENGYQSAFMAPTEILAEQHYKTATQLLVPLGIKVSLLIGSMKEKQKKEIYHGLASGETHLCIGTHALIQEKVEFKNLSLAIVDEQHRFGVDQRGKLKNKGVSPHFLVMTATPIPRSLAMTIYGDLDVSIIDEKPVGRIPILTRKAFETKRSKVMQFMVDQLEKGRQAYIVYPLVEESEKIELKSAIDEFEKLKKQYPKYSFGLLHGRMKSEEKDEIMREFRDNKIQVLVATTVIEVGVDVPNANIMIIEHTERFGLSQLHQLRGRVGRGEHRSYCILMLGYAQSDVAKLRAEIMEETNDGFKIAEKDLEIRGPGEFLGRKQSGLPGFKIANLVRDQKILQMSKQAAFELIDKDPDLKAKNHEAIVKILQKNSEFTVG